MSGYGFNWSFSRSMDRSIHLSDINEVIHGWSDILGWYGKRGQRGTDRLPRA